MMQQAEGLALATGAKIDFKVDVGYPTVDNEPVLTDAAWKLADQFMGAENVEMLDLRMTAEDFAFYSQHIPACFYRLGTGNKKLFPYAKDVFYHPAGILSMTIEIYDEVDTFEQSFGFNVSGQLKDFLDQLYKDN
mgnify:CR=1 FL=1